MRWPWARRELRAESPESYTAAVLRLLDSASSTRASALEIAALEIAAGLYERSFALADVAGDRAGALTAPVLAMIGRELTTAGEAVLLVEVDGASVRLVPAASWDVTGGRGGLRYRLELAGPDRSETWEAPAAAVVHIRRGTSAGRPWAGVAPWRVAASTSTLAARIDERLAQEMGGPVGSVLAHPPADFAALAEQLKALKGELAVVETADSWSTDRGAGAAQGGGWRPQRIGPDPPEALEVLRSSAGRDVLAACGVPPALFDARSTQAREALRQFLHAGLQPLARLAEAELREKLDDPALALSFDALMAADLSGRARAFQSLVKGGMPLPDAARLAGLLVDDDAP